MKKIPLLLCFLLLCCCSEQKMNSGLPHFTFDSKTPLQINPDFKDVEIVPLETTHRSLLGNFSPGITTIKVSNSLIFIKDDFSLFVFNKQGKFISKIGSRGEGPEEYGTINDFFIDETKTQIVLIDELKHKFFRYDFHGNFLYSENAPPEIRKTVQVIPVKNGMLLNHYINFEANNAYTLIKENKVESVLSYEPVSTVGYMYVLSRSMMTRVKDDIDFILPLNDTIYTLQSGNFVPKYIVDLPSPLAPRDQFSKTDVTNSHIRQIFKFAREGFFTGFYAIFETEKMIYLSYRQDGMVMGYYLGNKKSMNGNYYLITPGKTVDKIPFFNVQGNCNDAFIGISSAQELLSLKDKINSSDENPQLSKLKQIIENLKYDDNPVLFFYYI